MNSHRLFISSFDTQVITFLVITFCLICLLQFSFVKCYNNFFSTKVKAYVYDTVFLTFLITKTSSDQFGNLENNFLQRFLYFGILTWSPTSNIVSQSFFIALKSTYVIIKFTSTCFTFWLWYDTYLCLTISSNLSIHNMLHILIMILYVLLCLLTISSNLSVYTFFWYWSHIFVNLFFKIFSDILISFLLFKRTNHGSLL